ncbi:hypothetical protein COCVIDRAFT_89007, partial [Bipolaris victoriae FI3]
YSITPSFVVRFDSTPPKATLAPSGIHQAVLRSASVCAGSDPLFATVAIHHPGRNRCRQRLYSNPRCNVPRVESRRQAARPPSAVHHCLPTAEQLWLRTSTSVSGLGFDITQNDSLLDLHPSIMCCRGAAMLMHSLSSGAALTVAFASLLQ